MSSSLEIPEALAATLLPHQISALHFSWERLVEVALHRKPDTKKGDATEVDPVHGCILGHSMGLGKTVIALAFVHLLRRYLRRILEATNSRTTGSTAICEDLRVVVICPISCVSHWETCFGEWMRPELFEQPGQPPLEPATLRRAPERSFQSAYDSAKSFYTKGGMWILGYEQFMRLHALAFKEERSGVTHDAESVASVLSTAQERLGVRVAGNGKKDHGEEYLASFREMLQSIDLVILDEVHRFRKYTSKLVQEVQRSLDQCPLRLALTGTPIQNHLAEYTVMQSVVLGKQVNIPQFHRLFIAPIERGQCVDSTYAQVLEMQRSVASLRHFFAQHVHHSGPEVLAELLPERKDVLVVVRLSSQQEKKYRELVKHYSRVRAAKEVSGYAISLHHDSSHLCLHPDLIQTSAEPTEENPEVIVEKPHEIGVTDDDSSVGSSSASSDSDGAPSHASSCSSDSDGEEDDAVKDGATNQRATLHRISRSALYELQCNAPKLFCAIALIRHIAQEKREKVVVFSQYCDHLQLVKLILQRHGVRVLMFTGQSSPEERRRCVAELQENPSMRVLLCSTKAGGVGIKLVAANHCLLLDVSWNPADDTQATYRIYRFGQIRPVTIYRFACMGTSEQIVFAYALQKAWVHKKVADVEDPQRQLRHQSLQYFTYPCTIPIPRGEGAFIVHEGNTDPLLVHCASEYPTLAHVLQENTQLRSSIAALVPYTSLLQNNLDDATRVVAARLPRSREQPPPFAKQFDGGAYFPSRSAQVLVDPVETCSRKLAEEMQGAAQHLMFHLIRSYEAREGVVADESSEVSGLLHSFLYPIVEMALLTCGEKKLNLSREKRQHLSLPGMLVVLYRRGVRCLVRDLLSEGSFSTMRSYLTNRIAQSRFSANHANVFQGSLLEGILRTRPDDLFTGLEKEEVTLLSTEMMLERPVQQACLLAGLDLALQEGGSHIPQEVLERMASLVCPSEDDNAVLNMEDADGMSLCFGLRHYTQWPPLVKASDKSLKQSGDWMRGRLELLWPAFESFRLPPSLFRRMGTTFDVEEWAMHELYLAARAWPTRGLTPVSDVAQVLQLDTYVRSQWDRYSCPRCKANTALRRIGKNALQCPTCRYNAEFEYRSSNLRHHHCRLFQLSVVCNFLGSVLAAAPLASTKDPSSLEPDATVLDVLQHLYHISTVAHRTGHHFVEHCMKEGVQALMTEFPPALISLLCLQCGVDPRAERDRFIRLLHCNSTAAWRVSLRPHVRDAFAQCCRELLSESALVSQMAMPFILILLALHVAARDEGILHAHQLLVDNPIDLGSRTIHRLALLRFAADSLVHLRYADEVQERRAVLANAQALLVKRHHGSHSSSSSLSSSARGSSFGWSHAHSRSSSGGSDSSVSRGLSPMPKVGTKREREPDASESDTPPTPNSLDSPSSDWNPLSASDNSWSHLAPHPGEEGSSSEDRDGDEDSNSGPNYVDEPKPLGADSASSSMAEQWLMLRQLAFHQVYGTSAKFPWPAGKYRITTPDGMAALRELRTSSQSLRDGLQLSPGGMTMTAVLDDFLTRVHELSDQVPVICSDVTVASLKGLTTIGRDKAE